MSPAPDGQKIRICGKCGAAVVKGAEMWYNNKNVKFTEFSPYGHDAVRAENV